MTTVVKTIFAKNFARNYENRIILGTLVDESFVPATQRIILKVVRFLRHVLRQVSTAFF